MVDATFQLNLDARGLESGARATESALRRVQSQATAADRAIVGLGRAQSSAFQATGGAIQLAGGVEQVANAFRSADAAAVALGSTQFLLDIGKTAKDFGGLRASIGGAGSALSVIGRIIAANPLLTIATALAAAADAMGLFGTKTKEASEQVSIAKKRADEFRDSLSEIASAAASGQSLASAVRSYLSRPVAQGNLARLQFGQAQLSDFAFGSSRFGDRPLRSLTPQDPDYGREFVAVASLRNIIPNIDGDIADEVLRTRQGRLGSSASDELLVSRQDLDSYLQRRLASGGFEDAVQTPLSLAPKENAARYVSPYGGIPSDDFYFGRGTENPVSLSDEQAPPSAAYGGLSDDDYFLGRGAGSFSRRALDPESYEGKERQESIQEYLASRERELDLQLEQEESAERAAAYGRQLGESVGAAAAQMLLAGASFRSVLASFIRQTAASNLQAAGGSLFASIAKSFASTPTQNGAPLQTPGATPRA